MQDFQNLNIDVDVDIDVVVVIVDVDAGHPNHHHYHYSLVLYVIFPRYYGEFGMPDLWNHTNCPDPCLTYSCPKVFKYSTTEF